MQVQAVTTDENKPTEANESIPKNSNTTVFVSIIIVLGLLVIGLAIALGIIGSKYHDQKRDKPDEIEVEAKEEEAEEEEPEPKPTGTYKIETDTSGLEMTFTPDDGYDYIFLFLGGISNLPSDFEPLLKAKSDFFTSNRFKIVIMAGDLRPMQFMKYYYNISTPVPGWFNVDENGVVQDDLTTENNEVYKSQQRIITKIKNLEKEVKDKKHIFLGGFSQGAIMVNNVMLNLGYELGGFAAVAGYPYDPNHLWQYPYPNMSALSLIDDVAKDSKKSDLLKKCKDYHILVMHSLNDDKVPYYLANMFYQACYKEYTNLEFVTVGNLTHDIINMPMDQAKNWIARRIQEIEGN